MGSTRKEFVSRRFQELFAEKWTAQGKKKVSFVDEIKKYDPELGITKSYLSQLLRGLYAPSTRYLHAICHVLDVNLSEFEPKTHDEKYQFAVNYANGLEGKLEELARNKFKIDLTFFQGIRNIIPEFDDKFPVFSPLFEYGFFDENHKPYERLTLAETSKTSSGVGLFQITRDGETYFLTKYDMKFIKDLQDKIKDSVEKSFKFHQIILEEAEAKADERISAKIIEYNPNYKEDRTLWVGCHLSKEELQEIDKSGFYTDAALKEYNLPPEGTPIYDDNSENGGADHGKH